METYQAVGVSVNVSVVQDGYQVSGTEMSPRLVVPTYSFNQLISEEFFLLFSIL